MHTYIHTYKALAMALEKISYKKIKPQLNLRTSNQLIRPKRVPKLNGAHLRYNIKYTGHMDRSS